MLKVMNSYLSQNYCHIDIVDETERRNNMNEKMGRNDHCWCDSGKKYKSCHMKFDQKLESLAAQGHIIPSHDMIKTSAEIEMIRRSA